MHFLNKMERKFGRFAIQGLMKYIILFLCGGISDRIPCPAGIQLFDVGTVSDIPLWTGMEIGVMGIDSTANRQLFLCYYHDHTVLSVRYCPRTYLGCI